ncbi:MFS transporter [Muricauda sp. HICW]|uniref:MFS transporter n=1 Tax=Flagellimonas chongwuensis TaxID=2697365 RepID=A0A850NHL7_9FLAO|nr:MFS transporter [Allomuricauda chongwuensis]NVN17915.1 MFS transporter [Allomuricauda chongwuensis]
MKPSKLILPIIVLSQFCCTSLWFAGNGVMRDLVATFGLNDNAVGHLTSAVQLGFIVGTLVFAVLSISDRFSPSKVFFACAIFGALFNLGVVWEGNGLASILSFRFITGFFLAGIYPVGMKIAADHFEKGLGKSLGFLVGALVVGTAFPHVLKEMTHTFSWKAVLMATSALAILGGTFMLILVPNGPYRKHGQQVQLSSFLKVFQNSRFRSAAFGYFGHMWELYTFWAFVPIMLQSYALLHPQTMFNVPLLSFLIIGIGGLACVLSGYLSQSIGTKKVAFVALLLSCICCLVSPFLFGQPSTILFIAFLMFWGMVVIADSPLFSTLVAQNASAEIKGTALTILNCIGFAITIVSIQLLNELRIATSSNWAYMLLALGPILGLLAMASKGKNSLKG